MKSAATVHTYTCACMYQLCVCVYEKCTIAHSNGNYLHIGHWFTWCCCSKNNNRNNWQWQPHAHTHPYICKCKYVCVCVCGLCRFINILSTWLCFMRNYSSATDCYFRRGLFCVCPKGNFLLPLSFYLTLSPSVALFLIIVFIVFTLSYACKYFSLLQLIFINIFQHFLYLPWHFIAFLHISFICSIM